MADCGGNENSQFDCAARKRISPNRRRRTLQSGDGAVAAIPRGGWQHRRLRQSRTWRR